MRILVSHFTTYWPSYFFFTQNLCEILPPACSSMIIITVFRVLVVESTSLEASAPITHSNIDCILHVYLVKVHPSSSKYEIHANCICTKLISARVSIFWYVSNGILYEVIFKKQENW